MDPHHLTQHIGKVLRELRQARGWTLDQLAAQTGVSKPMLGQIERGESNPTVVTLWKIASGLHVPFATFLDTPAEDAVIVKREHNPVVLSDEGAYRLETIFSSPQPYPLEVFYVRLGPCHTHHAKAHGSHIMEVIWVLNGQLTLTRNGVTHELDPGDSIRFTADYDHAYQNQGTGEADFLVWLIYREN